MSEQSAGQAVRSFYDLVLSGKVEQAIETRLEPDFVWENPLPTPIPFGGVFEGAAGAARYLEQVFGAIGIESFAIEELIEGGDRVVVLGREAGLVRATGKRYAMEWVHVLRVRDGRILHLREYNDTAALLAAFA